MVVAIKALACELPHEHGLPLARLSVPEIRREALQRGLVASIGETTVWRWLAEDAIRPWHHRSWLFPRDPDFEEKAARILDLYAGLWRGRRLSTDDCILSADEKTSIQARRRVHPTSPPAPGRSQRVEHEYERLGAWAPGPTSPPGTYGAPRSMAGASRNPGSLHSSDWSTRS